MISFFEIIERWEFFFFGVYSSTYFKTKSKKLTYIFFKRIYACHVFKKRMVKFSNGGKLCPLITLLDLKLDKRWASNMPPNITCLFDWGCQYCLCISILRGHHVAWPLSWFCFFLFFLDQQRPNLFSE